MSDSGEAVGLEQQRPATIVEDFKQSIQKGKVDTIAFYHEVIRELTPPDYITKTTEAQKHEAIDFVKTWIHIPYLPALHQPGWLLKYLLGPYDYDWAESILADIWAGLTVGLTVIPQGLSYAQLANLQPIQGLYAAVLPSAMYTFFGSSLQLSVGPVAVVSMLTGNLVAKYVPNYATEPNAATDAAGEIAFAVGMVLVVMSVLNMGNFIRYVNYPVMSGFTSGAAFIIGLSQLKSAFGFGPKGITGSDVPSVPTVDKVPNLGQTDYTYNYQIGNWYIQHWYDRWQFTKKQLTLAKNAPYTTANAKIRYDILYDGHLLYNHYAVKICFGLYAILMTVIWIRGSFKDTPERKKNVIYRVWIILAALAPFFGIIVTAIITNRIKHYDHYTDPLYLYSHNYDAHSLNIVGVVPSGLGFIRKLRFPVPFSQVLTDSIPLALVSFMEAYSVARRMAVKRGELHILNSSQELFANGLASVLAGISSGYPVSGSFSRSALNFSCDARTPLSKCTSMIVVIVALVTLTSTFQYIPNAALTAVIWAAIYQLISFSDLWDAWKNNKKDFIVMFTTWLLTFTFNTEIGLAAGLGFSGAVVLFDHAFAPESAPEVVKRAKDNNGIDVIRVKQDMVFVTVYRVRDVAQPLFFLKPHQDDKRYLDRVFISISSFFDYFLIIRKPKFADFLPKAIVLDLSAANIVDLTATQALGDLANDARRYGVKFVFINASPAVEEKLIKYDIVNDAGPELEEYLKLAGNIPTRDLSKVLHGKLFEVGVKYRNVADDDSKESELVKVDIEENI